MARVLIVGAGLSGLIIALKLSYEGHEVVIVEETTSPGGMLSSVRIGKEYIEKNPHHLRKTDKALLNLIKEEGLFDKITWYDACWYGKAKKKKIGYFDNGFAELINLLVQQITDNRGMIFYSSSVCEISSKTDDDNNISFTTSCIMSNGAKLDYESDFVVFTGSCRSFINVAHGLPISLDTLDQLMNIKYKAAISIMLILKKGFSESYLWKIKEPTTFNRIVNHSAIFGTRNYGGYVTYLVGDIEVSDDLWIASDEDIMSRYYKDFKKMIPNIRKSDIKSIRINKVRYATPDSHPMRDLTNPLENLYISSSGLIQESSSNTQNMEGIVLLSSKISQRILENIRNRYEKQSNT